MQIHYRTEYWYKKKAEILIRDEYECKECKNVKLSYFTSNGIIKSIFWYKSAERILNDSNFTFDRYFYAIKAEGLIGNELKMIPFVAKTQFLLEGDDYKEFLDHPLIYSRGNSLLNIELRIIKTPEKLLGKFGQNFCVPGLHVHHLAYKKYGNHLDVPDNYLITLCPTCHQEKHPDKPIIGLED